MRTDIPADLEKTQAPPSQRDVDMMRAKQAESYETMACGREMTPEGRLEQLFCYHPPTLEQLPRYEAINQAAKNFAAIVLKFCPPSADRSDAIRKIREARMTANAAVALNGLNL